MFLFLNNIYLLSTKSEEVGQWETGRAATIELLAPPSKRVDECLEKEQLFLLLAPVLDSRSRKGLSILIINMNNKRYRRILKFDIEKINMVDNFQNLNVKFSNTNLEISPNGGLFFVSKNFKSTGKEIFKDKNLDNAILVFKSNGDVYARLLLRDSKRGMFNNIFGDIVEYVSIYDFKHPNIVNRICFDPLMLI